MHESPRPFPSFVSADNTGLPNGQYDFILNPQTPQRRIPMNGLPRLPLLIAAIVGILIVVIIIASLLLNNGGANNKTLLTIAQQQTELIRISDDALTNAKDSNTKALAATTKAVLSSDQEAVKTYLARHGMKKLSDKQLVSTAATADDEALKDGLSSGKYDVAYLKLLSSGLQNYQQKVSAFQVKNIQLISILDAAAGNAKALRESPPLNQ